MKWQTYPEFLVCAYMYAWAHTFLFNILIQQAFIVSVQIIQFRNHRTGAAIHMENNIQCACFGSAQSVS